MLKKKVAQKYGLLGNFQKIAQSKQSSIGRKFAQSGHPGHKANLEPILRLLNKASALVGLSILAFLEEYVLSSKRTRLYIRSVVSIYSAGVVTHDRWMYWLQEPILRSWR
jgi:hypothetical protein